MSGCHPSEQVHMLQEMKICPHCPREQDYTVEMKTSRSYQQEQDNTMNKHVSWMMRMITYHIAKRFMRHFC